MQRLALCESSRVLHAAAEKQLALDIILMNMLVN
jgi:hypothetical protein